MNASAHHLLSAYLDGELSPEEREDVEQLLEKSPEARQELNELKHVGQLLRELPQDALLSDAFSKTIMQACDSAQPIDRLRSQPTKRPAAWQAWGGVGLTAAALIAVAIIAFPKNTPTEHNEVAQRNETAPFVAAEKQTLEAEGSPSAKPAESPDFRPMVAGSAVKSTAIPEAAPEAEMAGGLPTADPSKPVIPTIRLTVTDRAQAEAILRKLLRENRLSQGFTDRETDADAEMIVETSPQRFQALLRNLQAEKAFKGTFENPQVLAQLQQSGVLLARDRKRNLATQKSPKDFNAKARGFSKPSADAAPPAEARQPAKNAIQPPAENPAKTLREPKPPAALSEEQLDDLRDQLIQRDKAAAKKESTNAEKKPATTPPTIRVRFELVEPASN